MADKKNKKNKKSMLADQFEYEEYKNSIPEEEIWTWKIEGLHAPHVGKPFSNAKVKKVAVVIILVIAIGLSIFFSIRSVHNDTYKIKEFENGYELIKFSNPGDIFEVNVDYYENDPSKPYTAMHEFCFNCDEKITKVTIGKDVKQIDGKSFYSCYSLRNIEVDENNPYYCDVDGVLFNKDKTLLICYPIDHDYYLREKYGYEEQLWPLLDEVSGKPVINETYPREYADRINTYVVPDTVKTIGKLAFNYSELFTIYLPEGLEVFETMALFRNWHLCEIYSYDGKVEPGVIPDAADCKNSLPDSLREIGSDCFNSDIELDYMYIPAGVEKIGHHAFWGAARKEPNGFNGLYEIHVQLSEEEFKSKVSCGDQWTGEYDNGAFPKRVPVVYGETRQ